jgi:hypothetical protein
MEDQGNPKDDLRVSKKTGLVYKIDLNYSLCRAAREGSGALREGSEE